MQSTYANYLCVYTDGSRIEEPCSVSSAVYISYSGRTFSWKLDNRHSVIGAELHAIQMSLAVIKVDEELSTNNVVILTDSRSSCMLISSPTGTYANTVAAIQLLLLELNQSRSVRIQWIKAHANIPGNEAADEAAKEAHSKSSITVQPLCLQENQNSLYGKVRQYWEQYWIDLTNSTTTGLHLRKIRNDSMNSIQWPMVRKEAVILARLRVGHVGLNAYLARFNMSETPNCDFCNVPEDVDHYLLHCCKYMASRMILESDVERIGAEMTLSSLLGGTTSGKKQWRIVKITLNYVKSTRRFRKYLKY